MRFSDIERRFSTPSSIIGAVLVVSLIPLSRPALDLDGCMDKKRGNCVLDRRDEEEEDERIIIHQPYQLAIQFIFALLKA